MLEGRIVFIFKKKKSRIESASVRWVKCGSKRCVCRCFLKTQLLQLSWAGPSTSREQFILK